MSTQFRRGAGITAVLLVIALALGAAAPVQAAEVLSNDTVIIDNDINDDVYAFGQSVVVNATIDGDLVVFGATVEVNGTVTGDVIAGAQTVIINGTVEDDVRAGAMIVKVGDGGEVGGDLVAGGWAIDQATDSTIAGDVLAAGGQVALGNVGEDVAAAAGGVLINGEIGGDADLEINNEENYFNPQWAASWSETPLPAYSAVSPGLTFGSGGQIDGTLNYSAPAALDVPAGAVGGEAVFTQMETPEQETNRGMFGRRMAQNFGLQLVGRFLGTFLMLVLVGAIFQWATPTFLNGTLAELRARPLASLGIGFVGFFALLVAITVLIFLTVLGAIPLGLIGAAARWVGAMATAGTGTILVFNILTRWVAPIAVALLVGRLIFGTAETKTPRPFWSLVVGALLVAVVLAIPIVGRLLGGLLIGAIGLGAAVLYLWGTRPASPEPTPAVVETPVEPTPRADV